jgi:hypothetical protein
MMSLLKAHGAKHEGTKTPVFQLKTLEGVCSDLPGQRRIHSAQ